MKPSIWMLLAGGFAIVVGMVVALGRTRAKRAVLYNQLRQHRFPDAASRWLATYWPERLLSWALQAVKRYDRRSDQAKKQAAKILHLPPRRRFPLPKVA